MTTRAAKNNEGASRARRWLSRALVVAGGAVAATATAWLVSTGAASASVQDHLPGVDTDSVTSVVSGTVGDRLPTDHSAQTGGSPDDTSPWSKNPLSLHADKSAHKLKGNAERLWKHRVAEPLGDTVHTVVGVATDPPRPDALGGDFWKGLEPGSDDLVALPELQEPSTDSAGGGADGVTLPVQPASPHQVANAADDLGVHPGDAQSHGVRAGDAVQQPAAVPSAGLSHEAENSNGGTAPAAPERLPMNHPSVLPGPVSGGSTGGSHIDSPMFGIPAGDLSAFDNAVAGSVLSGVRHLPTQPGSQPGVTPD